MEYDPAQFNELVSTAAFAAAREMIQGVPFEAVDEALSALAYDTQSICTYGFVAYLLAGAETAEDHFLAALLLSHPLCHLTDAYRLAFFHTKRAVELAPERVRYREYLLYFYRVPDSLALLSQEEAEAIARDVLVQDPSSVVARNMLAGPPPPEREGLHLDFRAIFPLVLLGGVGGYLFRDDPPEAWLPRSALVQVLFVFYPGVFAPPDSTSGPAVTAWARKVAVAFGGFLLLSDLPTLIVAKVPLVWTANALAMQGLVLFTLGTVLVRMYAERPPADQPMDRALRFLPPLFVMWCGVTGGESTVALFCDCRPSVRNSPPVLIEPGGKC